MSHRINLVFDILKALNPQNFFSKLLHFSSTELSCEELHLTLNQESSLHCLCLGKAASFHAAKWQRLWDKKLKNNQKGKIYSLTKKNHALSLQDVYEWEADHPLVSEKSIVATNSVIKELETLDPEDCLVLIISGGTSALLESFVPFFSLQEVVEIHRVLLNSGLAIEQMNELRKSLSLVKNGGLLRYIPCKKVVSFFISDVSSNNIASIGSSPTYYHELKVKSLLESIEKLRLTEKLKQRLKNFYKEKVFIDNENEKQAINFAKECHYKILSDYRHLISIARAKLEPHYQFIADDAPFSGEVESLMSRELMRIKEYLNQRVVLVSTGEATIKLDENPGLGGRNTHFVLLMTKALFYDNCLDLSEKELKELFIVSVGTDGTDGPTDVAGAWIDFESYQQAQKDKLNINQFIKNFNSYEYFSKIKNLLKTGPTGTNVMDLRLIFIGNR